MTDIKALLRKAATALRDYERDSLAAKLETEAEDDAGIDRYDIISDELSRFRAGYQGSCYACEPVGERNVELEDKVRVLWDALDAIAESDPDECAGRLRAIANEALATMEDDPDDDFTRGAHDL